MLEPDAETSARALVERPTHLEPEFEIVRFLGQGSSARVYLACEVALERYVTIKVLRSDLAGSEVARARFEREARTAASVDHPNVAGVLRFGVLPGGEPYLIMRYVPGRTLEHRLAAEGPLSPADARRVIADVASALDAAHSRGVVHRDIRPNTILVDEQSGRAIVTDFGVAALTEQWHSAPAARLTATGQILGDSRYASPEQLRGEPVTGAADVYSMALVACELFTGKAPYADADARTAMIARLTGAPGELPTAIEAADRVLADVLRRCLAADPARRPSARAVARRLAEADDEPWSQPLLPLPAWVRRTARVLYHRRVPQWIAGTGAGGWVLLQVVGEGIDHGVIAGDVYYLTFTGVIAAIATAAVLAWFHGESGQQRFRSVEIALLGLIGAAWLAALLAVVG